MSGQWNLTDNPRMEEEDYAFRGKDMRLIVGLAVRKVPGVLGLKPSLTDVFKPGDDWSRGVTVHTSGREVKASVKIIADEHYDTLKVAEDVVAAITEAVEDEIGKLSCEVEADIVDVMSEEAFCDKYVKDCEAAENLHQIEAAERQAEGLSH